MKLGLVKFLNARPLDHGFRLMSGSDTVLKLTEDTPAELFRLLQLGELDAALISSVEVLRNKDSLAYCKTVGVCADSEVRSILYIKPRSSNSSIESQLLSAPLKIYADNGSRTSISLLKILLYKSLGIRIDIIATPPKEIPSLLLQDADSAGLLIGDSALEFQEVEQSKNFYCKDLGIWWNELTGLPFVFALWAYPKQKLISDRFFEDSLQSGLDHLDEIISESIYEGTDDYLRNVLHYRLNDRDHEALKLFNSELAKMDLL